MGQAVKGHPARRNEFYLTLANLPAPDTRRWVASKKIFVVRAVEVGLLTFEQASKRYSLSFEEFVGWRKLAANFDRSGVNSALRDAFRTDPLWVGLDRDGSRTPFEGDFYESFQLN